MNKTEALEFLELKSNASETEISKRLVEKKIFFEQLSQNAPSDFLRKLHLNNLEKIKEISNLFSIKPDAKLSHSSGYENKQPIMQTSQNSQQILLIRHTEGFSSQTFLLAPGLNYIGRQTVTGYNSIIIDDPYVSRQHAIIDLTTDKIMISDSGLYTGKASKNGVYINGNPDRISGKVLLRDGDTIQIGQTKLVVKARKNETISEIVNSVSKTEYIKTVVIDIF